MEHVVFFPAADGTEAFRRAADLEEAVRLVEHLRNDNGVGDASVFALHPVPLAFRTYVHVELPISEASAELTPEPEAAAEVAQAQPTEIEDVTEAAEPEVAELEEPAVEEPAVEEAVLGEADQAELVEAEVASDEAAELDVAEVPESMDPHIPPPPPMPPSFEVEPVEAAADEAEPSTEADGIVEAEQASGESQPEVDVEVEQLEVEVARELLEPAAAAAEVEEEFPAEPTDQAEGEFEHNDFESTDFEAVTAEIEAELADEVAVDVVEEASADPVGDAFQESLAEALQESLDESGDAEPVAEPLEEIQATQDVEVSEQPESAPAPTFIESSPAELPPLTLAPGPLLFDGDNNPIATTASYDIADEAPEGDLPDLVPADFTDLIPADIAHGDLARHEVEAEPTPVAEEAPSTEDLPPMDVAEVPSDVSSIEMLDGAPIPVARETTDTPADAVAHHEGPRGLGYFGG